MLKSGRLSFLWCPQNSLGGEIVAVSSVTGGTVRSGSKVVIEDGDGQSTFRLVDSQADPSSGTLSVESPLGSALLGRRVGETVHFRAPGGEQEVRIVSIE